MKKIIMAITIMAIAISTTCLAAVTCPSVIVCSGNGWQWCFISDSNWRGDTVNTSPGVPSGIFVFKQASGKSNARGKCMYASGTHCLGLVSVENLSPSSSNWYLTALVNEPVCRAEAKQCEFEKDAKLRS